MKRIFKYLRLVCIIFIFIVFLKFLDFIYIKYLSNSNHEGEIKVVLSERQIMDQKIELKTREILKKETSYNGDFQRFLDEMSPIRGISAIGGYILHDSKYYLIAGVKKSSPDKSVLVRWNILTDEVVELTSFEISNDPNSGLGKPMFGDLELNKYVRVSFNQCFPGCDPLTMGKNFAYVNIETGATLLMEDIEWYDPFNVNLEPKDGKITYKNKSGEIITSELP